MNLAPDSLERRKEETEKTACHQGTDVHGTGSTARTALSGATSDHQDLASSLDRSSLQGRCLGGGEGSLRVSMSGGLSPESGSRVATGFAVVEPNAGPGADGTGATELHAADPAISAVRGGSEVGD